MWFSCFTASYTAAEDALKNVLNENPDSTDSVRSLQQKAVECLSESDSSDYEEEVPNQATANSESLVYLSEHEIQRNTVDVREYQLTGVPSTSASSSLPTPVDVREYQLTAVPSTNSLTTQHTSGKKGEKLFSSDLFIVLCIFQNLKRLY